MTYVHYEDHEVPRFSGNARDRRKARRAFIRQELALCNLWVYMDVSGAWVQLVEDYKGTLYPLPLWRARSKW